MHLLTRSRYILATATALAIVGCRAYQPPPRVAVPRSPDEGGAIRTYERLRPLPEPRLEDELPPVPYDDEPLVTQAPPEQPAYLEAYNAIGKPRIAVFVNRTVEGRIVPTQLKWRPSGSPSAYDDLQLDAALAQGDYDEAQARAIDYEAIEIVLTDILAANGRVTIVSPQMARQRLTDDEVNDLQNGRPQALREIAEKLDADVLVQAQARPTRQTQQGLAVRVLVEAINTQGGESIARAFVDVPPPLEKTTINRFTRFLARRTMYELSGAWQAMSNDDRRDAPQPTTRP